MRLQICAEIEGNFILKDKVETKLYPYEFSLFFKEGKKYISVSKPVKDYIDYVPKVHNKDGCLYIEATKPDIYNDMEEWVHYIEAMGAFNFEVSKIKTEELEVTWICEAEEEKGTIPIISLKREKIDRAEKKVVSSNNLFNIIFYRRSLPEAHIPFSYYRQAKTFFDEGNYYFAFINYFMMLEFCFADGKFHKNGLIVNFEKSNLLKLCILSVVLMLKTKDTEGNFAWLSSECQKRQKKVDFEGIVYILVEYRGLLSHASVRSKSFLFDDVKLRPLAFIIGMICFLLCGYMQVYCCTNKKDKNNMILDRINKLNLELDGI